MISDDQLTNFQSTKYVQHMAAYHRIPIHTNVYRHLSVMHIPLTPIDACHFVSPDTELEEEVFLLTSFKTHQYFRDVVFILLSLSLSLTLTTSLHAS